MTYEAWDIEAEFAPTFSPLELPEEADWVTLGTPLALSIRRGRQDDLDEFEAGTMGLVLDNSDENLDHLLSTSDIYDTEALPFTPVRVKATKGIDVRILFTGYTLDGFTPVGLRGGGRVTVKAVDWLGWAESVEAPESPWAAWVTYCKPTVWMRGLTKRTYSNYTDNPDGLAWNMAAVYTGAGGDFYPDPAYPSTVARIGSIVTDSSTPGLYLGDSSPGTTFGGLVMDAGDTLAQVGVWMAAGWFQAHDAQTIRWGGSTWSVYLNASGHVQADVDVGGFAQSDAVAVDHTDDAVHMWILKVTSTGGARSMQIQSDLGIDSHSFGAAASSGGGVLAFRGLGSSQTRIGDFVYWDDQTVLPQIFAATGGYDSNATPANWVAGASLWYGDTISERLPRIFRTAAATVGPYQVRLEADHVLTEYVPAGSLAADIKAVGAAYLGAAYVLRDGTVRIRDASMSNSYAGFGDSRTFDFTTAEARISDESATDTWTATVTDAFTRANNSSIQAGNTDWQFAHNALDGAIGVTSNTAYVSDASAAEVVGYFQDLGRDLTVTCDLTSVAAGMGVLVRYSGPGTYITVAQGTGKVVVTGWVDGISTTIGDTGSDALGSTLTVTTDDNTISVQIDAGTVHTFTITDATHLAGAGAGLAYTNIGVLPSSAARWDNFSATCVRPLIRPVNRSRTAPRADRVINSISVTGFNMYYQDADSIRRYGARPKSFTSAADDFDTVEGYVADILAERKDPTIEIGELTIEPWGNQYLTDWVMRDLELERAVTYREALYWAGTEVLDATYRITGESWDWSDGTAWTVTLKIVPA